MELSKKIMTMRAQIRVHQKRVRDYCLPSGSGGSHNEYRNDHESYNYPEGEIDQNFNERIYIFHIIEFTEPWIAKRVPRVIFCF